MLYAGIATGRELSPVRILGGDVMGATHRAIVRNTGEAFYIPPVIIVGGLEPTDSSDLTRKNYLPQ